MITQLISCCLPQGHQSIQRNVYLQKWVFSQSQDFDASLQALCNSSTCICTWMFDLILLPSSPGPASLREAWYSMFAHCCINSWEKRLLVQTIYCLPYELLLYHTCKSWLCLRQRGYKLYERRKVLMWLPTRFYCYVWKVAIIFCIQTRQLHGAF